MATILLNAHLVVFSDKGVYLYYCFLSICDIFAFKVCENNISIFTIYIIVYK